MEHVLLVDQNDRVIGTMEKMEAHQKGLLHRAFSVLLFNDQGQVLLQKRAAHKYHSAGLWTNTCCSHPQPNEKIEDAASRRLREEMGIDAQTQFAYKFIYKTALERELIEHEYDYVFLGKFNGKPNINKAEVQDWKFADLDWVRKDMVEHPDEYTFWFKVIVNDPKLPLIQRGTTQAVQQ
jgi:isopentenyl-diphosphate Delta-isomerase